MHIEKSEGVTRTERLLAKLCEQSFLKLWSYPNPWNKNRKEFCDVIAVFEDHVFIFFDRENRQFDNAERDILVAWERWKRSAIDNQIKTAHGAEGYLRRGHRLYLDNELTTLLPIDIDPAKMIIHKIIVAHGAEEACKAWSDQNASGSLGISYQHLDKRMGVPFIVDLDRNNPVHVLDSNTLPIILGELDTVRDLADFLDAKLEAVKKYDGLIYCGEEDLLAHYFFNFDRKKKEHFIGSRDEKFNIVMIAEGEWNGFIEGEAYRRKKEADRRPYLWDTIIQNTSQNQLNGTLFGDVSFHPNESPIHFMAKEPRSSRRALSEEIVRVIKNFPENDHELVRYVTFIPSFYKRAGYVFLQLKAPRVGDYETEYRPLRRELLRIACEAAKNKMPDLSTIVGIAIDAPKYARGGNSEDFLLLRCENWSEEDRQRVVAENKDLGFFRSQNIVEFRRRVQNFPDAPPANRTIGRRVKTSRNDLCPCGSGHKFKRCCGR